MMSNSNNSEPPSRQSADTAIEVVNHLSAMIAYWDRNQVCQFANDAYREWFGKSPDAVIGSTLKELLGPLYDLNLPYILRALEGEVQVFEREIPIPSGGTRHSLATYTPDIADGLVCGFFVHVTDVTALKIAQKELKEYAERSKTAIAAMQEGFVVQNQTGEITICNPSAVRILGLTADQMMGLTSLDPRWRTIHEDGSDFPGETHPAMVSLQQGISQREVVMGVHKPSGELTWISINSVPLWQEGKTHAVVVTSTDITERHWFEDKLEEHITNVNDMNVLLNKQHAELERANARLQELATSDGLTGIKNHRAFQEHLSEEFDRSRRYHTSLAILLLDVDHFKLFNDTFGHPAGDQILKRVAEILQVASRTVDFVARYGGEEFVVVLPETDQEGAVMVAERMRHAVMLHAWEQHPITVSIGVAVLQNTTEMLSELIDQADQALYRAKTQGRNRVDVSWT